MRTLGTLLAAGLALGGASASVAAATPRQLAPGVFAAPNTPAGKEYALRLQQARSTGSQSRTSHPSAPALFGAGIGTTDQPSAAATAPRPHPARTSAARAVTVPALNAKSVSAAGSAAVGPTSAASGSGGGGTLALVGGAAAIVVLAGAAGILFRRRLPPGPSA